VLDNYIIEKDGLWVFILIKTDSSHFKAIFIPSTNGEVVLNPMEASLSLIKITNQYFPDSTHLFVSPYTGLRLTVCKTKSYIREVMRLAGIPDNYGVYSIKHATISYFLKRGISEETINKISRYSFGSTMVSKQYAVAQDQRNVYKIIADFADRSAANKPIDPENINSSARFNEYFGVFAQNNADSEDSRDSLPVMNFLDHWPRSMNPFHLKFKKFFSSKTSARHDP
jgi:hypothetical protein